MNVDGGKTASVKNREGCIPIQMIISNSFHNLIDPKKEIQNINLARYILLKSGYAGLFAEDNYDCLRSLIGHDMW